MITETYLEYRIDWEPTWLYKARQIKNIDERTKLEFIWRIDEIEDNLGTPLPTILKKMRDKWIYTPISKKEYIDDLIFLNDFEQYVEEMIIEKLI